MHATVMYACSMQQSITHCQFVYGRVIEVKSENQLNETHLKACIGGVELG